MLQLWSAFCGDALSGTVGRACCCFAAKLRTSMSMHNDQEYGKSIMTSHEIIDRDKGDKCLLFILYAKLILYLCLNIVFY